MLKLLLNGMYLLYVSMAFLKRDDEFSPLFRFGFQTDRPSHFFYQTFHQIKPDSGSLGCFFTFFLIQILKNLLLIFFGNSRSFVFYGKFYSIGSIQNGDLNFASFWREFDGI